MVGSLAPGPGEFPSISEMDQSLCLPSFPSHGQGGGGGGTMPSIGEELEVSQFMINIDGVASWKAPTELTINSYR